MIGVSTGGKEENDIIVMEYEEEGEVYYVYPTSVSVLLPPLPSSFCKNTASIKLFDDQNVPYIRENSLKYHFNSLRGRKKNFQKLNAPYVGKTKAISKNGEVEDMNVVCKFFMGGNWR